MSSPPLRPAAWQAVSTIVSYVSLADRNSLQALPVCTPHPSARQLEKAVVKDGIATIYPGPWIYENCTFDLDRMKDEPQEVYYKGLVFKNCIIHYSGGQMKILGEMTF